MTRHASDEMAVPFLEQLEPRLLLATIPAMSVTGLSSQVEVGQAAVSSTPTDVLLRRVYQNPVVFVTRIGSKEADPTVARISNVQADQFTVQLVESPVRDGVHANELVCFMVLEAGLWQTPEGTIVEAGVFDSADTVGPGLTNSWTTVAYQQTFTSAPVLLTQVQTDNDVDPNHDYVTTRETGRNLTGFQVAMEHAESIATTHAAETIGYLAMSQFTGTWQTRRFISMLTAPRIGKPWRRIDYSAAGFTGAPLIQADLGTYNESDPAHLRLRKRLPTEIDARAEEDKTSDPEIDHTLERVDFVAVQGTGFLRLERVDSPAARRVFAGSTYQAFVMNPTLVGTNEDLVAFDLYVTNITGNTDFNPDAFDSSSPGLTGIQGQFHQHYSTALGSPTTPTLDPVYGTPIDTHFLFGSSDVLLSITAPTEDVGVAASTEPSDATPPFDVTAETSFGSLLTGTFAVDKTIAAETWQLAHIVIPRSTAVTLNFGAASVSGQEHIDVSFIV